MCKKACTSIFLLVLVAFVSAQEVRKDKIGRLVLLSEDGSWRFVQPKDSQLVGDIDEKKLPRFYDQSERQAIAKKKNQLSSYLEDVQSSYSDALNRLYFFEESYYAIPQKEISKEQNRTFRRKKKNVLYHKDLNRRANKMLRKYEKISAEDNLAQAMNFAVPVYKEPRTKTEHSSDGENKIKNLFSFLKRSDTQNQNPESPNTHNWLPTPAHYNEQLPVADCAFSMNKVDNFSGNARRELKKELLFRHSDPQLLPYLKGSDHIRAHASLLSVAGGYRFMRVEIDISSRNAAKEYGYIENGGILNLRLLDGSTVSLFSQNAARAQVMPDKTRYEIIYPIDYQKQKLLQKSELDMLRIVWSSGYEDYEASCVDFFIKQFECLEQ